MTLLPLIFADMAQLAIGWALFVVGTLIGAGLVAAPGKRKNPSPDEAH